MKNIFKSFLIVFAAASMFAGCSEGPVPPYKAEQVDPYSVNWTYLRPKNVPTKVITCTDAGELVGMFSTTDTLLSYVQCTKPAPKDIQATFAIDESLIEAYNTANGTNCILLNNVSLVSNTLTVKAGNYISADTLKITYDKAALEEYFVTFSEPAEFLVPIVMTSVSDGGTMSETNSIYLYYKLQIKTTEQTEEPFGQFYDRTNVIFMVDGYEEPNLKDNSTYTDVSFGTGVEVYIDLGEEVQLTDIRIRPYADSWYYMFKNVSIQMSVDDQTYFDAGTYELYSSYNYYITWFGPKTVRYVKMQTSGYQYSSSYKPWISEIEIYVKK